METMKIVFLKDSACINDEFYTKQEMIRYIKELKFNSKKFSIKKEMNDFHKQYILSVDGESVRAIFSRKDESEYVEILESWYQNSKMFKIAKLKLFAGLLTGTVAVGAVALQSPNIGKKIREIPFNVKFYIDNVNKLYSVHLLEKEIRSHAGYGEVDGYKQSIQDHNNSFCRFGGDVELSEMDEKIEEFCKKYNLGEQVSTSAYEKFSLLYNDETEKAYEIDLKDVYKENKQKVHTNN